MVQQEKIFILGTPCKTQGGTLCVFPFKYNGKTHDACTLDGQNDPWCSTKVDANGQHVTLNWGDCAEGCPGVSGPGLNFLF